MNQKFNPSYNLLVEKTSKEGEFIKVALPFTMEAKVVRNNYASAMNTEISIYNLNEISRSEMHKHFSEIGLTKSIILSMGYGDSRSIIFSGNVFECNTERVGVDVITRISSHDGGECTSANGFAGQYSSGTSISIALNDMLKYLEKFGVLVGKFSNDFGSFTKDTVFTPGVSVIDHIKSIVGDSFYLDNNVSYILSDSEVLPDSPLTIDADTGLLEPPVYEGSSNVRIKMVFEPNAKVGQKANLRSNFHKKLNGNDYKIIGISHDVKISISKGGINTTTLTLNKGFFTEVSR